MPRNPFDTRGRETDRGQTAVLALAVLLAAPPAPAAPAAFTYSWGHPSPQGNTVFAIAFADDANGWAVGGSGFVLRTTDGGVQWSLQHGPEVIAPDLYDLVVTPAGTLVACGDDAALYRSTDEGATWDSPAHPAATRLRDLAFRPDGALSAAGDNGVVLLSTDDGNTWSSIGPGLGTVEHHAWRTATEGYAVGTGVSHRTTNGGATWTQFIPPEFFGYNEVYFTDAQHGYVVEDFSTWSSTDAGVTWTEWFNPTPPLYRYRTLPLTTTHWLTVCNGEGAELWETTDSGTTWTQHLYVASTGSPCIARTPGGRVVFGSDTGDLRWTDDLGVTIEDATSNYGAAAPNAVILALAASPGGALFAANQPTMGEASMWVRSDDGGLTWNVPSATPGLYWANGGAFLDDLHGATGQDVDIRSTSDGGATWQSSKLPAGFRVAKFALPAADRYFVATWTNASTGNIFRSTDAGLTWSVVAGGLPAGTVTYSDIEFPDPQTGFAVGATSSQAPRIYRTTDGGASWTMQAGNGLSSSLRASAWFDAQTGVVAQGFPTEALLRTTDGGMNWTSVLPVRPQDIVVRDGLEAVAIPTTGTTVLHTTDAGVTWTDWPVPFRGPFPGQPGRCTSAVPTADGWLFGGDRNRLLVAADNTVTAVPELPASPVAPTSRLALSAAPNPVHPSFGGSVSLRFSLAVEGAYRLSVYDLSGRRVRALSSGTLVRGDHAVSWDGRDDAGHAVAAGVYLARLSAGGQAAVTRIVRLR